MKHPLLRVLVSDWRRKLTALGLAFALWLWVDGYITVEETHSLRIVTTPVAEAVEPGTLQIRVPEGWTLTGAPSSAAEGQAEFTLHGSPAEIDAFLATGFSATFDPELDRLPPSQSYDQQTIRASDLRWSRPEVAARIIKTSDRNQDLNFDFDEITLLTVPLGRYLFDVTGAPPSGFLVLEEELSFSLSNTKLRGPARVINSMTTALGRRLEAYEAGIFPIPEGMPALFEPIVIPSEGRIDLEINLELSAAHIRAGLELVNEAGALIVRIPVRLEDPDPRKVALTADMLTIVPDPEDEWEAPDWVQTDIRIQLSSVPNTRDISGPRLFRHLMFILPLDRIPTSALSQDAYDLQVDWTLIGLEEDEKTELLRRLKIRFEDPSKQTVTVQRKR